MHCGLDSDHIDVGLDVPVFELVYNLHLSYFLGLFGPDVHDGPLYHVFDLGDLRVIFDLARDRDRVLIAFLVLLVQIFLNQPFTSLALAVSKIRAVFISCFFSLLASSCCNLPS